MAVAEVGEAYQICATGVILDQQVRLQRYGKVSDTDTYCGAGYVGKVSFDRTL
jgi:hypothetical protein